MTGVFERNSLLKAVASLPLPFVPINVARQILAARRGEEIADIFNALLSELTGDKN
jgi:hypothetical protein